jgi:hypothetical protein
MSDDIVEVLRGMRPADAGRVAELFPRASRLELFDQIVSRQPSRRNRWRPSTIRRVRRPALISALGAVAVAAAAAALLTSSALRPQTAAAVAFRTAADGDIVATVTDPFAAAGRLKAAFAAHGFDITVNLLPVSPSLVGTVVSTSDNGGASQIQPLQGGQCITGGGGCPIGLKIPATFTGKGDVTLGRPAKPGETYESQASAFAPGEVLHCSGLLGARAATAVPMLRADELIPEWRETPTRVAADGTSSDVSKTDPAPPPNNYIWDAEMIAPGKVMIRTQPAPWPADSLHGAAFNRGC